MFPVIWSCSFFFVFFYLTFFHVDTPIFLKVIYVPDVFYSHLQLVIMCDTIYIFRFIISLLKGILFFILLLLLVFLEE